EHEPRVQPAAAGDGVPRDAPRRPRARPRSPHQRARGIDPFTDRRGARLHLRPAPPRAGRAARGRRRAARRNRGAGRGRRGAVGDRARAQGGRRPAAAPARAGV
ncbi:MAG: hypothetical protein AVDCRST_MAG11-3692, partial [uncultured Gemmatimonadaceae bacterium]